MIKFGKMEVEGFASIGNEKFDWGIFGLNIIQAPNGNGKTTFINALMWCIFGKPLTGSVEPWEHARSENYVGTKVSIWFNDDDLDYRIIRYKDYPKLKNSLIFEIDGEAFEGDKNETNAEIQKTLGYSYDLFKNSIIFGQKLKRIISETGPNKKKVFDEAFEVLYIPKAKKLAEEKLKEFQKEGMMANSAFELINEKVSGKESEIEAERGMVNNFENNKKREIKTIIDLMKPVKEAKKKLINENPNLEIELHESKLDLEILEHDCYSDAEYLKMEKDLTKLEGKKDAELERAVEIQQKISQMTHDLENLPDKCDKCQRAYSKHEQDTQRALLKENQQDESQRHLVATNNASILNGQIKELNESISSALKTKESITSCKEELGRLEKIKNDISDLEEKIQKHRDNISNIKKRELQNNIPKLEIELTDLRDLRKKKRIYVALVGRDIKTYEWLIKDPLSNAGLKAFIFNQMLDDINERLEFYTQFIGFQVAFMIDMKSANKNLETYVFQGDNPVPYDDLSGGQQQRVDIATAFAIHDIVSDTKECMLLVMDEVFESLDKDNIEIMTDLIQDKAQTKCLYLVTHRAEFNPTNANIIQIDYVDGITTVA